MKGWLQVLADEAWDFRVEDDRCLAIPQQWSGLYDYLRSRLRILHAGVTLGELKGRDWQPHHSLAMSTRLNRGVFPEASLDYTQAVAYLRKETVMLEPMCRAVMCCSPIRAILWVLRRISATVPTISIRRMADPERISSRRTPACRMAVRQAVCAEGYFPERRRLSVEMVMPR